MIGRIHLSTSVTGVALLVAACSEPGPVTLELRGQSMGTTYSVQVVTADSDFDDEPVSGEIRAILESIDRRFSTWRDDSDISRFNQSLSTGWQDTSREACRLVDRAIELARQTGGRFDPTVGPLVDAWGFGRTDIERPPTAAELALLLDRVGYRFLQTDCNKPALRKLQPDVAIDLSGFAKGHAVDMLAGVLERRGFDRYLVEIGGEIRARGRNGDAGPWRIAIENAVDPSAPPVIVLPMTEGGLATSGDYRNVRRLDGHLYSHIIDPSSGYPVDNDLAAVTILAGSTAEADALATALLVMGPSEGTEFARRHRLAAGFQVAVAGESTFFASPALEALPGC